MSDDFSSENSGINPLGWWLIGGALLLIVIAIVYGIAHTGSSDIDATNETVTQQGDAIDVKELAADARIEPTPPSAAATVEATVIAQQPGLLASPTASQSPTPQHTPSAMELWRRQEAQRALEASPIVAAFEPKPNQVMEIPSQAISKLQPPASPWTIDEGSIIKAIMMFGVNSDYPGNLVAQIEQPLHDSATGRYLLIPAGSKLIGKFQALNGPFQERIAIDWHRLVLPNNWSMPLPEMPSADGAGFAGVTGDVNHHYAATIGATLLTSMLSIGPAMAGVLAFQSAQTSPYGGGVYQTQPSEQIGMMASNSLGSQMGSTANRYISPYLNRPNTVTIPPGTRFDVFVNADLIMPGPYQDSAGQLIDAQEVK
jgi:type IV secretory pathway VirB10-like protein